jgi:hypothetical protein
MHRWMSRISPTGSPAGHFEHPRMFPILQLPEWIAESLGVARDPEFHEAVTYSSICGYYHTRLIDNLMDGNVDIHENINLLPIAGVLASEFQFAYQMYFPPEHVFWKHFRAIWLAAAESAGHDAALEDVSAENFERISSRKFAAAGIPVAASCLFYDKPLTLPPWIEFTNSLGRWSQMFDDVLDWHEDREHGRATWFLSEAQRRKLFHESIEQWVIREGSAWGFVVLKHWMNDLQAQAVVFASTGAREFLRIRRTFSEQKESELTAGYHTIADLAAILQLTRTGLEIDATRKELT